MQTTQEPSSTGLSAVSCRREQVIEPAWWLSEVIRGNSGPVVKFLILSAFRALSWIMQPETYTFADDGTIPNSRLPLILYRSAVAADPQAIEQVFARNDWGNSWRNGIYHYHHFHSIAHEVLGLARGEVNVMLGGPSGQVVTLRAGDVVVIPAGVGHCNRGDSADLLVIGGYPGGADYDICRGDPADYDRVRHNIAQVPVPNADPVTGAEGPLLQLWR